MGCGSPCLFAKFDPSLSKNTDNLLFFDEKDYASVQSVGDNQFASVTSLSTSATSYPSFLFKIKTSDPVPGNRITITWTGQTTTTVQPVYLQVYDHNVIEGTATSTTAWKTIAFRSATSINANFTLTGTITENFPVNNAGTTTRYFTRHQNGVDPIATTTLTLRVIQEHQTIGNEIPGPITLRTDGFTTSYDQPRLVQTAVLWENDDGNTPDTNSVTTGPASSPSSTLLGVRRGERLNLRIQVANTGTTAMLNKVLKLQYSVTSVGAVNLDCSIIPSASTTLWMDIGDGAYPNIPNVPTSTSPTSINYSLANSGDLADSVSLSRLPAPFKRDLVTDAVFTNGFFNDNSPRTATGVSLLADSYTELVFPVHFGDTMASSTICFRLVSETDQGISYNATLATTVHTLAPLDIYQVYAKAEILPYTLNAIRFSKGVQKTTDDLAINKVSKLSFWGGTSDGKGLAYDSFNRMVYLLGYNGEFARYDPATDTATDLSGRISSFWGTTDGLYLAYDFLSRTVYLTGLLGKFARYDPATNTAIDLTSKISSFWGTETIRAFYEPFNHTVYLLGSDTGKFARYDPASDAVTNLTSRFSFWGSQSMGIMTYDSFQHVIYIGGGTNNSARRFAKYDPATDVATDISSSLSGFWGNHPVYALTYDTLNHLVFVGGGSYTTIAERFAQYDPATNTAIDHSSKISAFWGNDPVYDIGYDSFNHVVYLVAQNGEFAKFDPASRVATGLTSKISSFWSSDDINKLIYDPFNHAMYLFGSFGNIRFARFDPDLAKNHDNLLFFDEKDYAGTATSDNIFSSVTAGPGTASMPAYATTLFKIKNPAGAVAEKFTVQWEGQSSTSATSVVLQIYDYNVTATSTTGWKTIATATAASFSVDTDVRLTVAIDNTYPIAEAASTSRYFTRHQNGVDPTATSTIVLRVLQQSMVTSSSPITLRTDTVCVTFGSFGECLPPEGAVNTTLTQNRFRFFENTDTATTTNPWPVGGTLVENEWIGSTGTPPITGTSVRIRVNIDVSGTNLDASATSFRLQVARVGKEGFSGGDTASSCSAIPAGNWANIGDSASTTAAWRGHDNGGIADNYTLSVTDLQLSDSDVTGTYEETLDTSSSTPANPKAVSSGQQVEYDFVVENNRARGGGEYCFRVVQSVSGTAYPLNGGYTVYPRIHVNEELTFSIDDSTVTFGTLDATNNFTAVTSTTATISTNAGSGYVVRAWATSRMTHVNLSAYTIADWPASNAAPTAWAGNCISNGLCGFGYSTDDAALATPGLPDRFTNPKAYAGFTHGDQNSNGDPVGDETATSTILTTIKHQIDYRISVPQTQAAGVYKTTVIYIATPTF
ncbi:MAG: hypothetical protein Q7S09_02260 [bacterium]|nr:hypothetical protein [bacterium]